MAYEYSVRIPVTMPVDQLRRDSNAVLAEVRRIVDGALAQVARLGGGSGSGGGRGGTGGGRGRAADDHVRQFREIEKEAARSAREVARINEQARRQADANDRLRERAARQLADVQVREARRAADGFLRTLKDMERGSQQVARGASLSWGSMLGAGFFASLGARAVSAFLGELRNLPREGIRLAQEYQNALKGLGVEAQFRGISETDAQAAIKNLRLVRGGVVSTAEAATTLRNLLATGFGLEKSVNLIERFSDAAAFGKQAALGFGEAIRGASEGIKNQNSLLVDNVGVTKNISVILKEYGFEIQDLYDKVKGASAREALYQGLLKETQAQVGNADKLMQGYTGTVAAHDLAFKDLQRTIGGLIINNPAYVESIRIVTEQIQGQTEAIKEANSETQKFVAGALLGFSKIRAQMIPFAGFVVQFVKMVSNAVGAVATAVVGGVLRVVEEVALGAEKIAVTAINSVIRLINGIEGVLEQAGLKGAIGVGGRIDYLPEPQRRNLGSDFFFQEASKAFNEMTAAARAMHALAKEGRAAREQIDRASVFGVSGGVEATRSAAAVTGGGVDLSNRRKKQQKIIDDAEDFRISEIKEIEAWFKSVTGRNLPVSAFGQSPYHNRLGLDHRNAVDVALNPNSPEGRLLVQRLQQQGVPHRAFTGPYRNAQGVLTATGAHIHIGQPSHAFGRNVRSRALTRSQLEQETSLVLDARGRFISPDELAARGLPQGASLLPFGPERLSGIQQRIQAMRDVRFAAPINESNNALAQMIERETTVTRARRESDEEYFGRYEETARGVYERVGGKYQEFINRQNNLDVERTNQWHDAFLEREHRELDYIAAIERAEADLQELRIENLNEATNANRRLALAKGEEVELTKAIQRAEDELANSGINAHLRIQLALLEDIAEVRGREEDAVKRINRAQLELANQTIYSSNQANASVLEFLASQRGVTEILADARVGVIQSTFDIIDRGLERFTRRLGIMGDLVRDLISGFARLALSKFFQSAFGLQPQGQGGAGFSLGNIFGGIFRGGGITGTPPFVPGGFSPGAAATTNPFATALRQLAGAGITIPAAASQAGLTGAAIQSAAGGSGVLGSGGLGALLGGGKMFGGLLGGLGAAAPLLGLGLGAQLGGGGLGSVLGGAGGGLLGLSGLAGAQLFGAFGLGGGILPSAAVGLLTNPFTLAIGGALLVGGLIAGVSARRRREEKAREQINQSTGGAIWALIGRSKSLTLEQAQSEWREIETRYREQISQFKGKTRSIAEKTWREHYAPLWRIVEKRVAEGTDARTFSSNFLPTFADGGAVSPMMRRAGFGSALQYNPLGYLRGPGGSRSDSILAYFPAAQSFARVSNSEYVIDAETVKNVGVHNLDRLRATKGRGLADGGSVVTQTASPVAPAQLQITIRLSNNLTVGPETAGRIVVTGVQTNDAREVVANVVTEQAERMHSDGLLGSVENHLKDRGLV